MSSESVPQVLPRELKLSPPPTMPQARSYLFQQPATTTEVSLSDTNSFRINVPRLQRSYLTKDSYLRFTAEYTFTEKDGADYNLLCLDNPGAFGFINKIEVYDYLGSTLLETVSGHGQLMSLLMDTSVTNTEFGTYWNSTAGCGKPRVNYNSQDPTGTLNTNDVLLNSYCTVNPPSSGQIIRGYYDVAGKKYTDVIQNSAVTVYKEYSIPLFSFLGLLSSKYAPLHNGYTIVVTTNTQTIACGLTKFSPATDATAASTTANLSVTLKDPTLCCQVLELGPMAEAMLLQSTGGQPLIVSSKSYRHYIGNISAGSSSFRLDLNLNVASLTNILWIMRQTDRINSIAYRSLSYRIRNYLNSWNFQYGSSLLPQTNGIRCRDNTLPVIATAQDALQLSRASGFTQAFIELFKARHQYHVADHDTAISAETFSRDTEFTGSQWLSPMNQYTQGQFACGLDLELVSGRSNDIICGLNTNGMNTSINAQFDLDMTASIVAAQVDAWCEYDSFINITPGIATTVSF